MGFGSKKTWVQTLVGAKLFLSYKKKYMNWISRNVQGFMNETNAILSFNQVQDDRNMEQQNRQEIEGLKVNLQMLADRLDADFAKNEGFEKETNAKFDFLQTQQDITFQGGNERFMEMSSELTEMTILQDKLQDKLKRLVTAVRGRDVIIEKLQADVKKNTRAVVALENSIQNLQMRITVREVETQHSSA